MKRIHTTPTNAAPNRTDTPPHARAGGPQQHPVPIEGVADR